MRSRKKKQPICRLEIDREFLELMLDSRASINLIDKVSDQKNLRKQSKTPTVSQAPNFLLWIIHTPTPVTNHLHQVNCKIQHHISDSACGLRQFRKSPRIRHCTEARTPENCQPSGNRQDWSQVPCERRI